MPTSQYADGSTGVSREKLARRIQEISSLPQVALRVMQVANDPNSGANDLKEVMETDAALSSRVLRCVNSSAFATRTRMTNLQQAIAYLGIQQVRNLALTASVAEMFKQNEQIGGYSRTGLWQHLVGVGICSRLIAMRVGLQEFEDAFLAGLLHDIGIVLEDQYAHKGFTQVIHSLDSYDTLGQAERDILGFDHMLLARDVARQWKFPEVVVDAILYHHDSSRCQAEHALVVNCVEVGNLLCTLKGIASVGVHKVGFPAPAIAALNLDKDDVLVLAQDFEKEMADNRDLLKI